jgi:hypothetical protein
MAIFTDGLPTRRNTTLDEYSAGLGETLVQVGREALIRSPLLSITRAGELGAAMEPERAPEDITPEEAMFGVQPVAAKPRLDAPTARSKVKDLNLKLEIPDDGINEEALNILIERKQDEVRRNDIIQRGPEGFLPGVAKFGTAFAASVLDPINVATAFVPVVGQARYAQLLARSGTTGARVLPRLAVGAAEGLAGAALVEPIIYASAKYEQADYGMLDSTLNIAFGAVFGGGLHVIGGTGADFYRAYRGRPDPFNRLQGLSTDQIRQVYEVDAIIAQGISSPEQAVEIAQKYSPAVLRASGIIRDRNVIDQEDGEITLPRGTIYGEDVQVNIAGQKIPAQWAVVDLVDVEAAMTKADNQWRDRTRQASSAQIRDISNNPDYDQLQWSPVMDYGAPTLSKDGLVIGGNGRVMGISTSYDIGKVGSYRSRLLAQLEDFGIDSTAIDGMKKPMLVRVLRQDVDVRQAAIISNEGGAARMSALEQAGVDAERMGDFRGFDIPDNGDLNTAGNRGAIKQWVGQFPINQQAALLTSEGYLSKEGLTRLRNAILYRAYGDTAILKRLVEATDDASANLSTALIRSAGVIADARARIASGNLYDLDISTDLQVAVERLIDMRSKGMDFDDLMRQGDILGIDMTPEQLQILRLMDDNIRSARAMSSFVNEYYAALDRQGDPNQVDLFGDAAPPTKQQLIDEALDRIQNDPTAAAKIERVSAETREAALKVSVAQLAEGRTVNVDPILESDPVINTATPESTLAAAQEQQSIDALLTADTDASAAVASRSKPVTDAEQALNDAMTTVDEVVQQGDQAYKYSRGAKKSLQREQVDSAKQAIKDEKQKVIAAADIDTIVNDERVPLLSIQDLDGMKIFPTIADRTAAGVLFVGIDSSEINISIPMLGGPLFPLRASNMQANVVWANRGKGVISAKAGKTKAGATHMMVVLGAENMHQSNTTVNNAFFQTLEAYARDRRITKKNSAALTELVKTAGDADANVAAAMQRFPGTDDADVLTKYIDDLSFNARSRLLDILGSKKAQDMGAPPLQKILDATRELEFAGARWGDGVLIVEIDKNSDPVILGEEGTRTHPDYPYGIRGKVVGRLSTPINYQLLWQDFIADSIKRTESRGKKADANTVRYDFQQSRPVVEVTQDLISRIGPLEQTNIDSPKQARMVADFVGDKWKTSKVPKNKGGISPQEFVDELNLSVGSAAFKGLTLEEVKSGIKSGNLTIYQLGSARAFFALETVGDRKYIRAMINNEQGAKGISSTFIVKAIAEGATHVEAFGVRSLKFPKGFLPSLFEGMGFRVVSETPTPKASITGKRLADAVKYWQRSVPEYSLETDGLPPLVTLEFAGGDRTDVTKRYIRNGITGLLGERVEADVFDAEARLFGISVEEARRGVSAEPGGVAGAEGVGAGIDITSRTRAAVEAIAKLRDNELTNLGLTAEDRAFAREVVKYSRGITGKSDSVFDLIFALQNSFGADTIKLLETGRVKLVERVADLPGGPHPTDVRGMTGPDGEVYIVAENVSASEIKGLVLHEVGEHVGMEKMLGPEVYKEVLRQVADGVARGEAAFMEAAARVPSDTKLADVPSEQLAYLIENAPELGLVKQIIAAVRAWAYRTFQFVRDNIELSEADIRALAVASLHAVAKRDRIAQRPEMAMQYSRGPEQSNDMAAEMRLFDEAIAKADVYGRAIRAAADRIGDDASAKSAMQSASEGTLTAQEIDNLLAQLRSQNASVRSRLRKIRNSSMAESDAASLQSDAMQAADELANNIKMAAVIEKRNAALNLAARMKALSFIQGEFQNMEVEGFKALIAGSEMRRRGARASAQSEQNQFLGAWMGGIIADMERAGLWQLFVSETMARETSRALYKMATPDADMTGIPAEAIKMAEIINKYQGDARNTQNRYGAWIRDLKGYIVRQTHDPFRIRKASFEEWRDYVLPRIDLDKTFTSRGVTDIEVGLREMYSNFASGMHMKFDPEEDTMAAFTGASMARRVSQSRTLYFKDGDAWFDYNDKFGAARLADAVLGGLERSARAAGLMKIFGTNPEATITRMLDEVENNLRGDPNARVKLHEARKSIMDLMSHVDGSANIPANQMAARISAGVRTWQSVSKLGGALISSFADIPVYGSEQRFQGRSMLSGMNDALGGLMQGRGSQEQQEIMNSLGVFFESMRNGVLRRFDGEENLGGFMSNMQTKFFKWNGLTWWTETLRKSAAMTLSSNLAFHRGTAFGDLRPDMQNLLNLYNIDAGKWDLIRMAATKEADGKMYLTPESFINIPRPALENYIVGVGRNANDATVQNLISDLQGAMRSMFIDRAEHAVIEPDARTRAFLLRGTNPGTVWGETARFIAQFKSFPVAILQKTIGREIYGRGYDTLGDYMRNGKGDMLGLAHLILWMTLFGYGSMTVKDLIKGRTPRDPLSPATWSAAMMQGGAFGIYGDFLFGEMKNRFGGGFLATVAGPTFGTVSDIADLWGRIRAGEDAAAQTFRLAIANTPFANLFYTRMALDYLILYRVQEWLNPGYLRRMERRIEKENDQTFLIKPSEVIR